MGFALYCHVLSSQIFLVMVWHWELFMLPLFLLLLIGWHYFHLSAGKGSSNQDEVSDEDSELFSIHPYTSVDSCCYSANSIYMLTQLWSNPDGMKSFWHTLGKLQFCSNVN